MYDSGRVHRTYKEHNRWMYVAPVHEKITIWDVLEKLIIILAFVAVAFSAAVVLVMPLIG